METAPRRFLSDVEARAIAEAGYEFLCLNAALARHAINRSLLRWKLLPKHHAFAHVLEDALLRKENPRAFHCNQDEDMIGQWKKLCCGTQGALMEYRLMAQYLVRLGPPVKL